MTTEDELFASVDALLEEEPQLPPPAERARLREAAGVTQGRLATVLRSTAQTVANWESGRSEPRPPRLAAYRRLLEGWAAKYPPPGTHTEPAPAAPTAPAPASSPMPGTPAASDRSAAFTASTDSTDSADATAAVRSEAGPAGAEEPSRDGAPRPERGSARAGARRTGRRGTAPGPRADPVPDGSDSGPPHGPLAVLDGEGDAHAADGLVLSCPAATLPELAEWALAAGLGARRLHRHGREADPLVVLTESAALRLGLPAELSTPHQRRELRLEDDHPVVREVLTAGWQLTRRGLGPWARLYRPVHEGLRRCVQLAVLPWEALDPRTWPGLAELPPPVIAGALTDYARRVLTPRGSPAVSGLELMTSLRPPTRPVRDRSGGWASAPNPGGLGTEAVDPAPPEAPAEHPVAQGWTGGFLDEEAYQWCRGRGHPDRGGVRAPPRRRAGHQRGVPRGGLAAARRVERPAPRPGARLRPADSR